MSDQPQAAVSQLVIAGDHRLLTLAVFDPDTENTMSAIYEHALAELSDEPADPILDANSEITSVLADVDSALVFGTIDGEVVFTGGDDDEMEGVSASTSPITALVEAGDMLLACTTDGEVLATVGGEVTPWKSEGPALFAILHVDGVTWVSGDDGYLARRDGEEWTELDTGTEESLQSLAVVGSTVIAVGGAGAVVRVEGEKVSLRTVGNDDLGGLAVWRGVPVVAAGDGGLRELTADGTKQLREGPCERVAADDKYLVVSSAGALLVTEDGLVWKPIACAAPQPLEDDDHDHTNCDHDHG